MPRPLSVTVRKPSASSSHLDEGGVAGDRLVHRIVDHLGEQVVQRLLVGAADIHAGPAAHRLQPFQHLDVGGRVAALGGGWLGRAPAGRGRPAGGRGGEGIEQVAGVFAWSGSGDGCRNGEGLGKSPG